MPPRFVSGVSDLVGVLHRTVHVANIADGLEEDVATMLLARCGEVERWGRSSLPGGGSTGDESVGCITIVFASVNSISTALQFSGIPFAGKQLMIWVANRDKPQSVLAIEGRKGDGDEESDEEVARRAQAVKLALERIRTGGGESDGGAVSKAAKQQLYTHDERVALLDEHCRRQCAALTTITRFWIANLEKERDRLRASVELGRGLLETIQAPLVIQLAEEPEEEPEATVVDGKTTAEGQQPAAANDVSVAAVPPRRLDALAPVRPPTLNVTTKTTVFGSVPVFEPLRLLPNSGDSAVASKHALSKPRRRSGAKRRRDSSTSSSSSSGSSITPSSSATSGASSSSSSPAESSSSSDSDSD